MLKITLPVPQQPVRSPTERRATENQVWLRNLVREDYRRRRLIALGASPALMQRLETIRATGREEHLAELRELRERLDREIPLTA